MAACWVLKSMRNAHCQPPPFWRGNQGPQLSRLRRQVYRVYQCGEWRFRNELLNQSFDCCMSVSGVIMENISAPFSCILLQPFGSQGPEAWLLPWFNWCYGTGVGGLGKLLWRICKQAFCQLKLIERRCLHWTLKTNLFARNVNSQKNAGAGLTVTFFLSACHCCCNCIYFVLFYLFFCLFVLFCGWCSG